MFYRLQFVLSYLPTAWSQSIRSTIAIFVRLSPLNRLSAGKVPYTAGDTRGRLRRSHAWRCVIELVWKLTAAQAAFASVVRLSLASHQHERALVWRVAQSTTDVRTAATASITVLIWMPIGLTECATPVALSPAYTTSWQLDTTALVISDYYVAVLYKQHHAYCPSICLYV